MRCRYLKKLVKLAEKGQITFALHVSIGFFDQTIINLCILPLQKGFQRHKLNKISHLG